MEGSEELKKIINNEYDYSNVLPVVNAISYLVNYCDLMNKQLIKLVEEDEQKNTQFKVEYKEYNYAKSYKQYFEVSVRNIDGKRDSCKDYSSFVDLVNKGGLKNVCDISIKLDLCFKRGKYFSLEEHENNFVIRFKPYDIKFTRKSNFEDTSMDEIEEQIRKIMDSFPVANCVFCDK